MTTRAQQNAKPRVSLGFQGALAAILILLAVDVTIATDEASNRRPLDLPSGGSFNSVAYGGEEEEYDSNVIEFYGGYYEGDAFFWCLDRSSSMGPPNPEDKLSMLKEEVTSAIQQLSQDNEFGIVSFATSITWFKDRPVRATGSQKQSAIEWVNSMQAYGTTCISLGVVKTLEISRRSLMKNRRVLIVGDGDISCPGYSTKTAVEQINAENWQRLPIDTIDIGSNNSGIDILKQIASENGGTYRLVN